MNKARYTRTEYITWTDRDGDHKVKVFGEYTLGDMYIEYTVGNQFHNETVVSCVRNFEDDSSYINSKSDFNKSFVEFFHGEAQDWVNSNCKR